MRGIWLASVAGAAMAGATASAAEAQTAPSADQGPPTELSEVVVQARRIDEPQQKVPVAITTIDAKALQDDTVTTVDDLQKLAPSLAVSGSSIGGESVPTFTIRGLSGALTADPSVVSYFDEVVADPRTFAYSMFDLASVQVLDGPQGTLFGKNSTGGAVLLAPNRPGFAFGGYLDGRVGNFGDVEVQGAVNLPVNETLAFRLAGDWETRDGTVDSVTSDTKYDDRRHGALRGEMLWKPSAEFENYLQGTVYTVRQHTDIPILQSVAACPNPAQPTAAQCFYEYPNDLGTAVPYDIQAELAQQQAAGRDRTVVNAPEPYDVDFDAITDIATARFGELTFKNIAHASLARYHTGFNFDGAEAPIVDSDQYERDSFWSEEMQLLGSQLGNRLKWIVGGYYSDLDMRQNGVFDELGDLPQGAGPPNPIVENDKEPQNSKAVFLQSSYDFSDWVKGLSLTTGYRYTWDHKAFTDQRIQGVAPYTVCGLMDYNPASPGFGTFFPGTNPATCARSLSRDFSSANWNVTLDWQANDKTLVYLAVRRGYKAGGFNFTSSQPQFTSYAPEHLTDYEVGLKADWRLGGMPIRTNLAVFESKYDNIQSQFTVVDPATENVEQLVLNQDWLTGAQNRATLWGGELQTTIIPMRGLQLQAFVGYTKSRYDQFVFRDPSNPLVPEDLKGQEISGIIPLSYGVTAIWRAPAPRGWGDPELSATLYGRNQQSTNPLASLATTPAGYATLDLRLDWRRIGGTAFDFALYGTNVADRRYIVNGYDLTSVAGTVANQYNEPAMFGAELRWRFGAGR
jgi:iron complex outermembrane receptor protein